LQIFTSCCPAWVNFIEQSVKNLFQTWTYVDLFKDVVKLNEKLFYRTERNQSWWYLNVSIIPSTAKKDENERVQLKTDKGLKETEMIWLL
jgi:NADH-quinone oxidoreductase subunit G